MPGPSVKVASGFSGGGGRALSLTILVPSFRRNAASEHLLSAVPISFHSYSFTPPRPHRLSRTFLFFLSAPSLSVKKWLILWLKNAAAILDQVHVASLLELPSSPWLGGWASAGRAPLFSEPPESDLFTCRFILAWEGPWQGEWQRANRMTAKPWVTRTNAGGKGEGLTATTRVAVFLCCLVGRPCWMGGVLVGQLSGRAA